MTLTVPPTQANHRPETRFVVLAFGVWSAAWIALLDGWPDRLVAAVFCVGLIVMARVDLREHRIPNRIVAAQLATLAAAGGIVQLTIGDAAIGRAALGAGVAFATFVVLRVITPTGIGMGDVKEALPLGFGLAWFSPLAVVPALLVAFIVNGLVCSWLLSTGRAHRDGRVAFGPSLTAGALIVLAVTT